MHDSGPARHLPAHHYTRERWHNGAGWTRRILRLPVAGAGPGTGAGTGSAATAGITWDLSLSIADIERPAAYSRLPGVEREQVLLSGDGLRLVFDDGVGTTTLLPPHQRLRFAGDRAVSGVPLEGPPVRAFNLMWRPAALAVELLHRPLVGGMFCFCDAGTAWAVYLIGGSACIASAAGQFRLEAGDSAWLAAGDRQRFAVDGAGEALLVRVERAAQ